MRRSAATGRVVTGAIAGLLVIAGCSANSVTSAASAGESAPAATGTLTVLAASSLTGVFETLAAQFEASHPGVTVRISFGSSSLLATQITRGAPADVFASAAPAPMAAVSAAGEAGASTVFARNVLAIAVPSGNPARIQRLADLARPGVAVAVCQPAAPCGAAATAVFAAARLTVKPVTEEADVKATLAKAILGEVDAAVVYVTDVRAAGSAVSGISIPPEVNAATEYPIAVLKASTNPALAQGFVDLVTSADGRAALSAAGFELP